MTIPLDPRTNLATFQTAPRYKRFQSFCAEAGIKDHHDANSPFVCYETQTNKVSTNDKDKITETETTGGASPSAFNLDGLQWRTHHATDHRRRGGRQAAKDLAAEFLRYHQKFNHVSPKKIQAMAKRGMLPRRLANCPVQLCTGIHKTIKWGLIHYGTNER